MRIQELWVKRITLTLCFALVFAAMPVAVFAQEEVPAVATEAAPVTEEITTTATQATTATEETAAGEPETEPETEPLEPSSDGATEETNEVPAKPQEEGSNLPEGEPSTPAGSSENAGAAATDATAPEDGASAVKTLEEPLPPALRALADGWFAYDGPNGNLQTLVEADLSTLAQPAPFDYTPITQLRLSGTVTDADFAFIRTNLFALETLDLSGMSGDSLPNDALYHPQSELNRLTSVTLPAGLRSIGNRAFQECAKLTFSNRMLPESITAIGTGAFDRCTDLQLTALPSKLTSIAADAFRECTSLNLPTLPSGLITIGDFAFDGCTDLALAELPGGLTAIGNGAFYGCTSLALTELPSGVTTIRNFAFSGCTNLALTALPSGLDYIGMVAFSGCTNLKELVFTGSTAPSVDWNAFSSVTATVYYPEGGTNYDAGHFGSGTLTFAPYVAPTAEDLNITGSPAVGTALSGAYTYNSGVAGGTGRGVEADTSTYQWYRSTAATWSGAAPQAIPGATAKTYTPTGADVGQYLYFEVLPQNGITVGDAPVQSAATGAVGITVSLIDLYIDDVQTNHTTFAEVQAELEAAAGASLARITLNDDILLNAGVVVPSGIGNIILNGNGYTITRGATGDLFTVNTAGNQMTVQNVAIDGNKAEFADAQGSLIKVQNGAILELNNTTLQNNANATGNGGGVYVATGGTLRLADSLFTGNAGTGGIKANGSAIYVQETGKLSLSGKPIIGKNMFDNNIYGEDTMEDIMAFSIDSGGLASGALIHVGGTAVSGQLVARKPSGALSEDEAQVFRSVDAGSYAVGIKDTTNPQDVIWGQTALAISDIAINGVGELTFTVQGAQTEGLMPTGGLIIDGKEVAPADFITVNIGTDLLFVVNAAWLSLNPITSVDGYEVFAIFKAIVATGKGPASPVHLQTDAISAYYESITDAMQDVAAGETATITLYDDVTTAPIIVDGARKVTITSATGSKIISRVNGDGGNLFAVQGVATRLVLDTVVLDGATIAANTGALLVAETNGELALNNATLQNNENDIGDGGAVLLDRAISFSMNSSEINNNTAANGKGGAIYANDSRVEMLAQNGGNTLQGNKAMNGGGVYVASGDDISLYGAVLENNTATTNGGGIYLADGETGIVAGSITLNSAVNGGGVYVANGAMLTTQNGTGGEAFELVQNTASGTAGTVANGIYLQAKATLQVNGGSIGETPTVLPNTRAAVISNGVLFGTGALPSLGTAFGTVSTDHMNIEGDVVADTQLENAAILATYQGTPSYDALRNVSKKINYTFNGENYTAVAMPDAAGDMHIYAVGGIMDAYALYEGAADLVTIYVNDKYENYGGITVVGPTSPTSPQATGPLAAAQGFGLELIKGYLDTLNPGVYTLGVNVWNDAGNVRTTYSIRFLVDTEPDDSSSSSSSSSSTYIPPIEPPPSSSEVTSPPNSSSTGSHWQSSGDSSSHIGNNSSSSRSESDSSEDSSSTSSSLSLVQSSPSSIASGTDDLQISGSTPNGSGEGPGFIERPTQSLVGRILLWGVLPLLVVGFMVFIILLKRKKEKGEK